MKILSHVKDIFNKKPFLPFLIVFFLSLALSSVTYYKRRQDAYNQWLNQEQQQYSLKEKEEKTQIKTKIEEKYKEDMTSFAILAKTAEIERKTLKDLENEIKLRNEKKALKKK